MTKTYLVLNDNDPNDSFEVEAENECDAAVDALSSLGWNLCKPTSKETDPNQYEFSF